MTAAASIWKRLWPCIALTVHAQAFAFDIDELEALIRKEKLNTVEAVIARLPQEYKKNYTLAFDSQSLQGSSYENPRAVLFGDTAQLVLTFNGDPSQQHYDAIETMQYRTETETFELRSIEFSEDGVAFSEPNPRICESCHGSPPHPVWSSYEYGERETKHWPGFYGSTHDAPVMDPEEAEAFRQFRERAAAHPRYRHLVLRQPGSPWFPYGIGPQVHRLRPNNRLGNLLARWHARQIVKLIRDAEFTERHPKVAQAWLLQCPGTGEAPYRQRVRSLFDARFPPAEYRYIHAILDSLPGDRQAPFMMEKMLTDLESFGWDMSVEKPESIGRFYTGIVTIDRLVGARWLATLEKDHWLQAYFEPWSSRELYNTFADGYYETNVAPGNVGQAYDSVALYYDEPRARRACPVVMRGVSESFRSSAWSRTIAYSSTPPGAGLR